jgi:hypothetical protein
MDCCRLLGFAMLGTLTASALHAQDARDPVAGATFTLGGVVRDDRGVALYGAEVRAGDAYATSDSSGVFVLRRLALDTVIVHVRRIGYNAAQLRVSPPGAGQRVELAVTLTMNAVELGTIVVEGKALDTKLWDAGFYQRQMLGRGRFITPDFWEHFGGAGIGTVLRETPHVVVERQNNADFAYSRSGQHLCRMNVFVDGVYVQSASPGVGTERTIADPGQSLDQIVPRDDIRAIEIYGTPSSVPTQYQRAVPPAPRAMELSRMSASGLGVQSMSGRRPPTEAGKVDCGAVVIWTRWYASLRQAP